MARACYPQTQRQADVDQAKTVFQENHRRVEKTMTPFYAIRRRTKPNLYDPYYWCRGNVFLPLDDSAGQKCVFIDLTIAMRAAHILQLAYPDELIDVRMNSGHNIEDGMWDAVQVGTAALAAVEQLDNL